MLLRWLHAMEVKIKNCQTALRTAHIEGRGFVGTDEDVLLSLAIGNRALSDMPPSAPSPGDKSTSIISRYQESMSGQYTQAKLDLIKDINLLAPVVEQIHNALSILPKNEREPIEKWYFDGLSWLEIGKEIGYSRQRSVELRTQGMKKLVATVKITTHTYDEIMENMGGI